MLVSGMVNQSDLGHTFAKTLSLQEVGQAKPGRVKKPPGSPCVEEMNLTDLENQCMSSWWFQPSWKISQIGSFPQVGPKKNMFETTTWSMHFEFQSAV